MKLLEKEEDFLQVIYEWFTFFWALYYSLVYFALVFGKNFSSNQGNIALFMNLF